MISKIDRFDYLNRRGQRPDLNMAPVSPSNGTSKGAVSESFTLELIGDAQTDEVNINRSLGPSRYNDVSVPLFTMLIRPSPNDKDRGWILYLMEWLLDIPANIP